jgi:Cof subfamily protein (haloacid dehalogenase superfamily)
VVACRRLGPAAWLCDDAAVSASAAAADDVPRLVATDLDGTLLRSDGTVSPRTRDVLRRATAAGARVVAVTGRPVRWMHAVAEAVQHQGTAVCSNGAVVYDLVAERVVQARPFPPETLLELTGVLRALVPDVAFGVESLARGFWHEPGYVPHAVAGIVRPPAPTAPLPDLVTDDVLKLIALAPGGTPEELLDLAAAEAGHLGELTHSTNAPFLEVSAPGVTKATTLAGLAEAWGVTPAEAVAFGDMPNDLAVLAWAGRSWATANAHPSVRAAAGAVTAANDDDGVAAVLETFWPAP